MALLAAVALVTAGARETAADPISIALHATNSGLSSIRSTVTAAGRTPDGRQIFEIVIHEDWGSVAPGVLTFSDLPERSILDITKFATNKTAAAWTSFGNRTATADENVPPFGILFEAVPGAFFSNRAGWRLTAPQLERCMDQFPTVCSQPFHGNAFTFFRGQIEPDTVARIRFALQFDRGNFMLTQTPNSLDVAPIPEPSTLLLVGTAGLAMWRARRRAGHGKGGSAPRIPEPFDPSGVRLRAGD